MRESLNPPAFAVDCNTNPDCDGAGMTLRDYFAAKAMQSYVALEPMRHGPNAAMAYAQADAMLKARQP